MTKEWVGKMVSRREFLATTVPTTAFAAAGCVTEAVSDSPVDRPLKVCVFADIHYDRYWPNGDNLLFLESVLARAEREECDLIIHLGDMVHGVGEQCQKAYVKRYHDFHVPGYATLGNHDTNRSSREEVLEAFQMPDGHYFFDKGGFRFVITDPNYFLDSSGRYVAFSNSNQGRRPKDSPIYIVPPEQLLWLRETLMSSPFPCVVLSHESFERPPEVDGVMNREDVQAVFNEANAKKPGTVRLVMNGHSHVDFLRVLDNILYWDVNSATYQYFAGTHNKYPVDFFRAHGGANHCLGWKDPLSAIVTLWPDGRIKIEGSKSDWLFGVTPQIAGLPVHEATGRYTLPIIQSADITFNYRKDVSF